MRGQDLLTALADELQGIAPELVQAYDAGSTAEPGDAARADDADITSVARLSEAAGYVGLEGVKRIATCVLANLDHLDDNDADARVLVRSFFTEWAPLLEAHLRDANAPGPIHALLEHFSGSWVPLPLEPNALQDLRGELLAASSIGAALDQAERAYGSTNRPIDGRGETWLAGVDTPAFRSQCTGVLLAIDKARK